MRVLFTEMVNTGEGTDLGGGHQDFRFGHIKFEMIMRHPSRNVMSVQFSSVIQSCPTLGDPKDCCTPDFSTHEISQARILEWVTISFSKESS